MNTDKIYAESLAEEYAPKVKCSPFVRQCGIIEIYQ